MPRLTYIILSQRLLVSLSLCLFFNASVSMSDTYPLRHFHYFKKLPAELRLQIWLLCLPHRISENYPERFGERFFEFGIDYKERARRHLPQRRVDHICKCQSYLPFALNSNRPVISGVCREARDLVLRFGPLEDCEQKSNWGHPWGRWYMWQLPNLSRAVYYSWRLDYRTFESDSDDYDDDSSVDEGDREYAGIRDELRQVFDRTQEQGLTFCTDWEILSRVSGEVGGGGKAPKMAALLQFARLALNLTVPMAILEVTIHIMRRQAATTNLFGRLAEEPCQDIDVDDTDTLAEYYALWDTFTVDKHKKRVARREVWKNILQNGKYAKQVAEQQLEWQYQMLFALWYDERRDPAVRDALAGAFPSYCNPDPKLYKYGFPRSDWYPPDYSHPWVAETWPTLPTLRPKIDFAFVQTQRI